MYFANTCTSACQYRTDQCIFQIPPCVIVSDFAVRFPCTIVYPVIIGVMRCFGAITSTKFNIQHVYSFRSARPFLSWHFTCSRCALSFWRLFVLVWDAPCVSLCDYIFLLYTCIMNTSQGAVDTNLNQSDINSKSDTNTQRLWFNITLYCFNSLWPSYAIWRPRSGSTLAQVMACCLTALSHYLDQCWLLINEVLQHLPIRTISQRVPKLLFCRMSLEIIPLKWLPLLLGANKH